MLCRHLEPDDKSNSLDSLEGEISVAPNENEKARLRDTEMKATWMSDKHKSINFIMPCFSIESLGARKAGCMTGISKNVNKSTAFSSSVLPPNANIASEGTARLPHLWHILGKQRHYPGTVCLILICFCHMVAFNFVFKCNTCCF